MIYQLSIKSNTRESQICLLSSHRNLSEKNRIRQYTRMPCALRSKNFALNLAAIITLPAISINAHLHSVNCTEAYLSPMLSESDRNSALNKNQISDVREIIKLTLNFPSASSDLQNNLNFTPIFYL